MANAVYPKFKESLLTEAHTNKSLDQDDTTNGPFVALVDTGTYTYSSSHQFYSSLSGIVGTDQRIDDPTVTNGTFDGGDVTFTSVSGATVEALVIYRKNSGANTTWRLVVYEDTSVTGLPVTPNGGNIVVTWNASGIFTISDKRLKGNIRLIGELAEVGVYEYSYIGSEQRVVGLMAQEVEQVLPFAVKDFGDFKAVDYEKVLAHAA